MPQPLLEPPPPNGLPSHPPFRSLFCAVRTARGPRAVRSPWGWRRRRWLWRRRRRQRRHAKCQWVAGDCQGARQPRRLGNRAWWREHQGHPRTVWCTPGAEPRHPRWRRGEGVYRLRWAPTTPPSCRHRPPTSCRHHHSILPAAHPATTLLRIVSPYAAYTPDDSCIVLRLRCPRPTRTNRGG